MTTWLDENDVPFGEWVPCTEDEYLAILNMLTDPVVMSGRTEVGERTTSYSEDAAYRNRVITSEWGNRGKLYPLVRCDDRWDSFGERDHTHAKFVAAVSS